MVEYRIARSDEREEYVRFANRVFNLAGDPVHFETSIPKVYALEENSGVIHYVAADDERGIVGLVGVLPGEMVVDGAKLKTAYVGTVSVAPEARSEGHMKRLMAMALEDMQKNGVDFAMLNGQRQRYEYFGFTPAGQAARVTIDHRNLRHALKDVETDGVTFEEILPCGRWEDEARALIEKEKAYYKREKFALYCRTFEHRPWAAVENGALIGYVVANAAKDYLPELEAISEEAADRIVKAWMQRFELKQFAFAVPLWRADVLRHFGAYAENVLMSCSVHARIFRYDRVIEAMMNLGERSRADGKLCFEAEDKAYTVEIICGRARVCEGGEPQMHLTQLEAARMLLLPWDAENRPNVPQGWFPLPMSVCPCDAF